VQHRSTAVIEPNPGAVPVVKRQQRSEVVCRGLRVSKALAKRIEEAVATGGYQSASAFMRMAIEREIAGRDVGVDDVEKRIAASLDRVGRELRSVRLRQQAEFAFLDALVKTILTHLVELPRDTYDQAVARGKARYDRFLKSVGMGMNGDSQAAITELLKRVEDE
jgi:Arc/MetJ-type ribon-helix-helix transcriptional regulator